MSRSALWHQEKNVQRRQQEADNAWETVVEEGRNNRARNLIPLWGPDDRYVYVTCAVEGWEGGRWQTLVDGFTVLFVCLFVMLFHFHFISHKLSLDTYDEYLTLLTSSSYLFYLLYCLLCRD